MSRLARRERGRLYARLCLRTAISFAVLSLFLFIPQIFSLCAPFLAMLLTAHLLNPVVSKLHVKLKIPRRLLAFVLVVLVFVGLTTLAGRLAYAAIREAGTLTKVTQPLWDAALSALTFFSSGLKRMLGFLPIDTEAMVADIISGVYLWLQSASKDLLNSILSNAAQIATKAGISGAGTLIFVFAAYLVTAEYDTIGRLLEKHLGNHLFGYFRILKDIVKSALSGFFRALLLLALLAFVIMFAALSIYGQEYAFLISLLLALVDFLPIVGAFGVLAPWGIVEMLGGDIAKGSFLIILAAAHYLLKRFVEPKILGSQTGLHPLAALMSIYIGMRIAGFWGAILGPVALIAAIDIGQTGIFNNTTKDIRSAMTDIADFLKSQLSVSSKLSIKK
jgi:sporulation integral membrane protein YtvI